MSGGSSGSSGQFVLNLINVSEGQVWQINRPIEFQFSASVDFSSVTLNTINIRGVAGEPVTGTFFFKGVDLDGDGFAETEDKTTVVFQPTCPTLEDLSDSGFALGGAYTIRIPSSAAGSTNTVRSIFGNSLQVSQSRNFSTPSSSEPSAAFLDPVIGPPSPIVRPTGSSQTSATYAEIGADDTNRVYFEFDPVTLTYSTNPLGYEMPLNLYSEVSQKVSFLVEFDQPVSPSSTNISEARIGLEFMDSQGLWQSAPTQVSLERNCTASGATVRLIPNGLLPQGTQIRAIVRSGFADLVGESNLLAQSDFAEAPTQILNYSVLAPADGGADELMEEFMTGAADPSSLEDATAAQNAPRATWGGGALTAGFSFEGTGGPDSDGDGQGDFDWTIPTGQSLVFDTSSSQIINTTQTAIIQVVGGVADVRNFKIEAGATLRVQGPNPFVLLATGNVEIFGILDISGRPANDVATLNTGNQPSVGGAGTAGGGAGGIASAVTTSSTPRGGTGDGPFGVINAGGAGGESGYNASSSVNNRRPGGGGGGRLGPNYLHPGGSSWPPPGYVNSYPAEDGFDGASTAAGALSGQSPPQGGSAGPGPFADGDDTNNFFGTRFDASTTALTVGELPGLTAGSGGGGGGDALPSNQFPSPNWTVSSDEKGGGGGGGGGVLRVKALGTIRFGHTQGAGIVGMILCEGGDGGRGENTIGLNGIGGAGGGGSGGMVILESSDSIDFAWNLDFAVTNILTAPIGPYISTKGGRGAVGLSSNPFNGSGGDGGPGVVQFHVPDPNNTMGNITFPLTAGAKLSDVSLPTAEFLVPTYGSVSQAQSRWIALGSAGQDTLIPVAFLLQGVHPANGRIVDDPADGVVDELPALISGPVSALGGGTAALSGTDTLVFTLDAGGGGSQLQDLIGSQTVPSNDIYLRSPSLLRRFTLRLIDTTFPVPIAPKEFEVASAVFDDSDPMNPSLAITMGPDSSGSTIFDYFQQTGQVSFQLIPRSFLVTTAGVENALPITASVVVLVQATASDASGQPDEDNIVVPWTGNMNNLNSLNPGEIEFIRFQVTFDLGVLNVTTKAVTLDFLRLPFTF